MATPKRTENKAQRAIWLGLILVVLIGLASYATYRYAYKPTVHKTTSNVTTTHSGTNVNQTPALPTGQQSSNDNKTSNPTPSTPPATTNGKQTVSVVITSSSPTAARAYISGAIEDGGTCTATYTNGSTTKSGTSTGISNATNTVCPPIAVSGVTSGTWSLTYSYSSINYTGSATTTTQL